MSTTRELYCNNVPTTLSSAVTSTGQTTFVVTSGLDFPKTGNFRILIGTEICIVTSVVQDSFVPATWTVTRAVEGTTAATYSSGTRVDFFITSQSWTNILHRDRTTSGLISTISSQIPRVGDMFIPSDSFYTMIIYDGVAWQFMHNGRALTPPQFNLTFNGTPWYHESPDGNFTLDTTHVANILYDATPGSLVSSYYTTAPATPYSFTCAGLTHNIISGYNKIGLGWRSNGGAYAMMMIGSDNGTDWTLRYDTFTSRTSYAGTYINISIPPMIVHGPLIWLRLTDDGTNRRIKVSSNGINWTDVYGISRTNFLTPDNIAVSLVTPSVVNTGMTLVHMSLS